MSEFTPSKYQNDFFTWVDKGHGSCVLVAVAGSGKTTSVIKSLRYVRQGKSALLLAFNSVIAKELQDRISTEGLDPRFFEGKTFHSLGFVAVRKYLQSKNVNVSKPDDKKCRNLVKLLLGASSGNENEPSDYDRYADFAVKLVGLAKGQGLGCLTPSTYTAWADLVSHHDLELDHDDSTEERGIEIARDLLNSSNDAARAGSIDFDDMLYCVVLWKLKIWQRDWVFIDEAQDTNPVRRAIAKLALRPGGRLVAVGDPRQAIYGFTGASHDAIDLIKREFNAEEMPLTVSYRCSKSIVELAQTVVPHIEAFEHAPDGKVETTGLDAALPFLGAHDAVLCRQTAPLINLAYTLIGRGIGCRVLGRDIGASLVSLVKRAKARGLDSLLTKLDAYAERETAKFTAKGEEHKADALNDRVESIRTVANSLPENERSVPSLIKAIENLFSDTNGCLTLSTIHKSKGKEWETVAILEPELMPSKWARQDWQYQQELNLQYVAYTRAKSHLIFIKTEKNQPK